MKNAEDIAEFFKIKNNNKKIFDYQKKMIDLFFDNNDFEYRWHRLAFIGLKNAMIDLFFEYNRRKRIGLTDLNIFKSNGSLCITLNKYECLFVYTSEYSSFCFVDKDDV